jgi:hypothetical protein
MDLDELVTQVRSRKGFLKVLDAVQEDYRERGLMWENLTLPDFLSAMHAWLEAAPQYYANMGLHVDADRDAWRVLADGLLAARVYE